MTRIDDFDTSLPAIEEDAGRYHARRAHQERNMAEHAVTSDARRSHTAMAVYHETMVEYDGPPAPGSMPAVGSGRAIGPN